MRVQLSVVAVAIMQGWSLLCNGADDKTRLDVSLLDGSRIIGVPSVTTFCVRTELGTLDVPIDKIQSVALQSDKEHVAVTLQNGDKVTGFVEGKQIKLSTLIGPVTLPMSLVRSITVALPIGKAKGLVLFNTLGSKEEIEHSAVGPDGTFKGGGFTEGVNGKAFVARYDENRKVTFPMTMIKTKAGCIELWARFSGISSTLSDGRRPYIFTGGKSETAATHYLLMFNANNGGGLGGLVGQVGGFAETCSTGPCGSWTYARVLGNDGVEKWHHYALVWDFDGIKGIEDGRKTVAVYLDGMLHASGTSPQAAPAEESIEGAELTLAWWHPYDQQGSIALDNLKVWDRAKTDFSDRFDGTTIDRASNSR